jgi:Zn-dependent protease
MASLVFEVKPKPWRVSKRHGYYSFSEMTEDHIGYIAAFGIIANLLFAVIGYLIGFELFSKINVWFAFFNMIPISDLDGNKIFFGNLALWNVLAILTLLGMVYAFFLV